MVMSVGKPVPWDFRYMRKLEGISASITTSSRENRAYPESWASWARIMDSKLFLSRNLHVAG